MQEELKRKYKSEIDTLEKENNEIKVAMNKWIETLQDEAHSFEQEWKLATISENRIKE